MSKERFVVKDVVCDYGVFDTEFPEESFICVCKARANALLIADILNTDYSKSNECVYWKDQQLAELKAENERLQVENVLARETKINTNKMDVLHLEIEVCELEQQLKEKDEEIERLKKEYAGMKGWFEGVEGGLRVVVNKLKSQLQSNTKQVCEKIREKTDGLWYFVLDEQKEHFEGNRYVLSRKDFDDILNLIEKGESK